MGKPTEEQIANRKEFNRRFYKWLGHYDADDFKFSDEHKMLLREQLRDYESSDIERFIEELEKDCRTARMTLTLYGAYKEYKDFVGDALKDLKKAQRKVRHLSDNLLPGLSSVCRRVISDGKEYILTIPIKDEKEKAQKIVSKLEELVESLEDISIFEEEMRLEFGTSKGRMPSPVKFHVGRIAESFYKCLGKPTTYVDGPFSNIVRISLEALGLPAKDPSRAIIAAVRNLDTE